MFWEGGTDIDQQVGNNCTLLTFPLLLLLLLTIISEFQFILNDETVLISTHKFYFDSPPHSTRLGGWWADKGGLSEWLHDVSSPVEIKTMATCHQGKFMMQGDVLGRYSSV